MSKKKKKKPRRISLITFNSLYTNPIFFYRTLSHKKKNKYIYIS